MSLTATIDDSIAPEYNAGTIEIGQGALVLTPSVFNNDLSYDRAYSSKKLFDVGQAVSVTSSGNQVPGFTLSTVGPSDVTWTSPACVGTTCTLDRAKDFGVSWSGGDIGWVYLDLYVSEKNEERVSCKYPANAHQATVPSAAFADFEVSSGNGGGGASLRPFSEAWVVEGKWAIELSVEAQSTGGGRLVVAQ